MEISITHKEDVPLLKRTEVSARMTYEGATPSRKEVQAAVAKALNGKKDQLIITKVTTKYGDQSAAVNGYYYSDRSVLEKLEQKAMIKKNTFEEEKKEEVAEEAKEEPSDSSEKEAEKKEEPAEKPKDDSEKSEEKPAEEKADPKSEEKTVAAEDKKKSEPAQDKKGDS